MDFLNSDYGLARKTRRIGPRGRHDPLVSSLRYRLQHGPVTAMEAVRKLTAAFSEVS